MCSRSVSETAVAAGRCEHGLVSGSSRRVVRRVAGWALVVLGTVPAALAVVMAGSAVIALGDGRSLEPGWTLVMVGFLLVGLGAGALGFRLSASDAPPGAVVALMKAFGVAAVAGGPLFGAATTSLANFEAVTGESYWPQGWAIAAGGVVILAVAIWLDQTDYARRTARAAASRSNPS
jgi:hypothetical protein